MCGIAGIHLRGGVRRGDLDAIARDLALAIDSRGGDATGWAASLPDGRVHVEKAACNAREFVRYAQAIPAEATAVIVHARYATQGHQGWMANNHPVGVGGVHVVHNGHVSNDDELLAASTFDRAGQVDTEAIAHVLAAADWHDPADALALVRGGMAIGALAEGRPGELLLARGATSPLVYHLAGDVGMFASTDTALANGWRRLGSLPRSFRALAEGEWLRLTPERIADTRGRFTVAAPAYSRALAASQGDYGDLSREWAGWAPGKVWDAALRCYVTRGGPLAAAEAAGSGVVDAEAADDDGVCALCRDGCTGACLADADALRAGGLAPTGTYGSGSCDFCGEFGAFAEYRGRYGYRWLLCSACVTAESEWYQGATV